MYSLPHTITKRNGKPEAFSLDKIKNAILKAAAATGTSLSATQREGLLRRLLFTDNMSVEEIQNQVEMALMAEGLFATAKAFIVYRNQHTEDRQTLQKLRFLVDYCNAANAATGSKFDSNANVENKNLATLIGELPKGDFIRLNRRLLCDRLKDMYGKEAADRYLDLLNHHFIYKNDETSLANYCASITMYPWLLNGTKSIGGNSSAPTNLKSFCGGFINMVFMQTMWWISPNVSAPSTRSSPTVLNKSSTPSTNPLERAISNLCSGTSPTTTVLTLNLSLENSSSPTALVLTGSPSLGCKNAS